MDYKQIIADSWRYTQNRKKVVRWLGVFPAIFTTTGSVATILYQFFAFKSSALFNETEGSFFFDVIDFIITFIKEHLSLTFPLVIVFIIALLIYLLLPTLAKAAVMQIIAREKHGQPATVGTGLRQGMMRFLPLFEYHAIIKTFSIMFILVEMSFAIRNLGLDFFMLFLPIFIVFLVIGLVLTLLFTYADFYIVIDEKGIFESMRMSAKTVVMNWKHTFLITILMLIIGVRVIIQAILVFLIPVAIIVITGYVAIVAAPIVSILIGSLVGAVGMIVAAYINGAVDIFSYSVWTLTFLEITSEKELSARDAFTDDIGTKKEDTPLTQG